MHLLSASSKQTHVVRSGGRGRDDTVGRDGRGVGVIHRVGTTQGVGRTQGIGLIQRVGLTRGVRLTQGKDWHGG